MHSSVSVVYGTAAPRHLQFPGSGHPVALVLFCFGYFDRYRLKINMCESEQVYVVMRSATGGPGSPWTPQNKTGGSVIGLEPPEFSTKY